MLVLYIIELSAQEEQKEVQAPVSPMNMFEDYEIYVMHSIGQVC